jgi:hypothetical protein
MGKLPEREGKLGVCGRETPNALKRGILKFIREEPPFSF